MIGFLLCIMGELVELISENFVSMRWKVHTWDTQKQSHTSVEHSGEPRNKPTCKWSVNLQKGKNMKGEKKKTAYSVNGTRKTGQLHAKE